MRQNGHMAVLQSTDHAVGLCLAREVEMRISSALISRWQPTLRAAEITASNINVVGLAPAIIIAVDALAAFAGVADEYAPRFDHLPNQRIPSMEDGFTLILQEAGYNFGRRQENFGKDRRKLRVREDIPPGVSAHQWRSKPIDNFSNPGLTNGV